LLRNSLTQKVAADRRRLLRNMVDKGIGCYKKRLLRRMVAKEAGYEEKWLLIKGDCLGKAVAKEQLLRISVVMEDGC